MWAEDWTQFYGGIEARGGSSGGAGGFAEVSGRNGLIFAGSADLRAADGSVGQLLLDPTDITIQDAGTTDIDLDDTGFPDVFQSTTSLTSGIITTADLESQLMLSDVLIKTSSGGMGAGNIMFDNDVIYTGSSPRTLTLEAEGSVSLNTGVSISSTLGALNLMFYADVDTNFSGDLILSDGASLNSNGGNMIFNASGFQIDPSAMINAGVGLVDFQVALVSIVDFLLGSTGPGAALSQAELDTITAGQITVSNVTGGRVKLEGDVTLDPMKVSRLKVKTSSGALDDATMGIFYDLSVQSLEISLGSGQILMGGETIRLRI
ncbi:MAG: hypothetical protein HC904_10235 [Blastochloris sp.]|nr:hypothetical protein [Blastochloris sp.]